METIFMNSENSKTSKPHRFRLEFTDKLDLKDPNKNMALANLSIYYTWKNIQSEYNNNEFKISAPTWNDTLVDVPDGYYSIPDFQDYFRLFWKNIKSEYNNNKFKISAPTWNDTLDLPDGYHLISDIQDYFIFINKKHETLNEIHQSQFFQIKQKTELFSK